MVIHGPDPMNTELMKAVEHGNAMTLLKRFLQWAAAPVYNPFDAIWLILFELAWHDKQWFAAAVFVIVGLTLSAVVRWLARRMAK